MVMPNGRGLGGFLLLRVFRSSVWLGRRRSIDLFLGVWGEEEDDEVGGCGALLVVGKWGSSFAHMSSFFVVLLFTVRSLVEFDLLRRGLEFRARFRFLHDRIIAFVVDGCCLFRNWDRDMGSWIICGM